MEDGVIVGAVIELAHDVVEIGQAWVVFSHGHVVEASHPLEFAIADKWISGQVEFWTTWKNKVFNSFIIELIDITTAV